jgi:Phage integrase, N-terminal SAM-like domain
MQGHIRRRTPRSYEYIVDVGPAAAQRCQGCRRRFWVERKPKESCPSCGGKLAEAEERRRETKAGFATRKECAAAMAKVLVAVEERSYVARTKVTVRDFLQKEWLPSIRATIRATTYRSYVQHVECHIVPHIGNLSWRSCRARPSTLSTPSSPRAARSRVKAASLLFRSVTYTPSCIGHSRMRSGGAGSRATPSSQRTHPE